MRNSTRRPATPSKHFGPSSASSLRLQTLIITWRHRLVLFIALWTIHLISLMCYVAFPLPHYCAYPVNLDQFKRWYWQLRFSSSTSCTAVFTLSFQRNNVTLGIRLLNLLLHFQTLCCLHYCSTVFPFPKKKLGGQILNLERIWKILLRNVRLLKRRVRRVKKELAYERLDWVPYPRNEPFSPLISQDATKFVLPLVFILIESAKSPLPVDMCHSKTSP